MPRLPWKRENGGDLPDCGQREGECSESQSGAEYHFEIEANTISDTSDAKNIMGKTKLDTFKTIFAVVNLSNPNESTLEGTITDYHDRGRRSS